MTRERTRELLPVLKAFQDGRKIQVKLTSGEWHDITVEEIDVDSRFDYRIKPTPREWWIVVHPVSKYVLWDKSVPLREIKSTVSPGSEIVRVRELME